MTCSPNALRQTIRSFAAFTWVTLALAVPQRGTAQSTAPPGSTTFALTGDAIITRRLSPFGDQIGQPVESVNHLGPHFQPDGHAVSTRARRDSPEPEVSCVGFRVLLEALDRRGVVSGHGGRIWIAGRPGGGTSVMAELPAEHESILTDV